MFLEQFEYVLALRKYECCRPILLDDQIFQFIEHPLRLRFNDTVWCYLSQVSLRDLPCPPLLPVPDAGDFVQVEGTVSLPDFSPLRSLLAYPFGEFRHITDREYDIWILP